MSLLFERHLVPHPTGSEGWCSHLVDLCGLLVAERAPSGQYEREPKDVIEELFRRRVAGDDGVIDELVAENLVNHAGGLEAPRPSGNARA